MEQEKKEVGRNQPCPCGSGKKYKRCHAADAAPKPGPLASAPVATIASEGAPQGGFDPSQLDPAMMAQVAQAIQRLPRGQVQKIQALMRRAMSGKDVAREAAELELMLPPDFKNLMTSLQPATGAGGNALANAEPMSTEEARKVVESAAAEGKISIQRAETLLSTPRETGEQSRLSKLWNKMTGKS